MKNQTTILLALTAIAGAAYWFYIRPKSATTTTGAVTKDTTSAADRAIGWQTFDDGTSIDPNGNYYQGGKLIYKANSP